MSPESQERKKLSRAELQRKMAAYVIARAEEKVKIQNRVTKRAEFIASLKERAGSQEILKGKAIVLDFKSRESEQGYTSYLPINKPESAPPARYTIGEVRFLKHYSKSDQPTVVMLYPEQSDYYKAIGVLLDSLEVPTPSEIRAIHRAEATE